MSSNGEGHHNIERPDRQSLGEKRSYRTTLSTQPSKIDFVITFKRDSDVEDSAEKLQLLLQTIAATGLQIQVREGSEAGIVLIFVKCTWKKLAQEVHLSRSRDWMSGIRVIAPSAGNGVEQKSINDSERLRLVFMMLTSPDHDGGAGITPKMGKWHHVESIFPLHNKEFDHAWITRWATKWTIDDSELDHLCEHFGSKVAMYFAFLQFYLISLAIPASLGLFAFFFLSEYSVIYSLGVTVWAIAFHGLWDRRQRQLAIRWDVRNCSQMEHRRAAFIGSKNIKDPVSGQQVPVSNAFTRLLREALTIPFGLLAGALLAIVLTVIFAVEVFIGEVYDGPLKPILTFTPTILFSVLVAPFSGVYMKAAHMLTIYENHETDAKFNAAITRKSFLLNFMTSYTALFLTLYVYLPFGHLLVPRLDILGLTSTYAAYGVKAKPFVLDNSRIRNQLFYFAVTAQIVNLFMEFVLPIILRLAKGEAQELQAKFRGHNTYRPDDAPEESTMLKQVRFEASLPEYDTYGDYAELVVQFGYTVMFSTIWPLTPVCAFVNNIIELRADAAKLCRNMKRPVPMRADSIGPWADNLVFLTWLGSLTTASISYLLAGDAASKKPFLHLLGICFFSEHIYLLVRNAVTTVLARIPVSSEQDVKHDEWLIRKQYLTKLTTFDTADIPTNGQDSDMFFSQTFKEVSLSAYSLVRKQSTNEKQRKKEL